MTESGHLSDVHLEELLLCDEITGLWQCTDPSVPCFELEEDGDEDRPLCNYCWVANSKGRCERTMQYRIYSIDGYWKAGKENFSDYLICTNDDENKPIPEGYTDDDIFFYGLTELDLFKAVNLKEDVADEFVITAYKEVW